MSCLLVQTRVAGAPRYLVLPQKHLRRAAPGLTSHPSPNRRSGYRRCRKSFSSQPPGHLPWGPDRDQHCPEWVQAPSARCEDGSQNPPPFHLPLPTASSSALIFFLSFIPVHVRDKPASLCLPGAGPHEALHTSRFALPPTPRPSSQNSAGASPEASHGQPHTQAPHPRAFGPRMPGVFAPTEDAPLPRPPFRSEARDKRSQTEGLDAVQIH